MPFPRANAEYTIGSKVVAYSRVRAVVSLVCLSARGKSQHPRAPNSTLYPFLELEAGSVPPSLNFPQLDFVKPSSGFHPVTWERVRGVANRGLQEMPILVLQDMAFLDLKSFFWIYV
jgi:hypothetical protein